MSINVSKSKSSFHPRNRHQGKYDFDKLNEVFPALQIHVFQNKYGTLTIDFADASAVKALNKALLMHHYELSFWDIPEGFLCPPIPGRADYVHYVADILAEENKGEIPRGKAIKCLDIGVGANCIYPIIGHQEYGWSFVGTDIDPNAVKAATAIVNHNNHLKNDIEIRLQSDRNCFFEGIIEKEDRFDATFCNPPFYTSAQDAQENNAKKRSNLGVKSENVVKRNFGGNANELWCEGGELTFILGMIRESAKFANQCRWFTTLVSKKEHLDRIYKELAKHNVKNQKTIEMSQGQKVSRLVAWSF